ncbi:MAG TPA: hypothetical protein VID73_00145 [Ktedonobacterales bacterium]
MPSATNTTPPARDRGGRPVIWDRASWHATGAAPAAEGEPEAAHIAAALRWLWARDLTTEEGDRAAQGEFSDQFQGEPALASTMVSEAGAIFLDHYYGRWLSSLPETGRDDTADLGLDALWDEYAASAGSLDRVWAL